MERRGKQLTSLQFEVKKVSLLEQNVKALEASLKFNNAAQGPASRRTRSISPNKRIPLKPLSLTEMNTLSTGKKTGSLQPWDIDLRDDLIRNLKGRIAQMTEELERSETARLSLVSEVEQIQSEGDALRVLSETQETTKKKLEQQLQSELAMANFNHQEALQRLGQVEEENAKAVAQADLTGVQRKVQIADLQHRLAQSQLVYAEKEKTMNNQSISHEGELKQLTEEVAALRAKLQTHTSADEISEDTRALIGEMSNLLLFSQYSLRFSEWQGQQLSNDLEFVIQEKAIMDHLYQTLSIDCKAIV